MDTGSVKRPHRPTHLPDYAEACLQALADHGMGKKISLGGALGLLHYLGQQLACVRDDPNLAHV